jgi:hypothetical protein
MSKTQLITNQLGLINISISIAKPYICNKNIEDVPNHSLIAYQN